MSKKLRAAIIGTGGISEHHIKGYKDDPDVDLVAFCDIDEAKLKMKGERHGVTNLYTDYNEMLAKENLDLLSVTTWNSEHAPAAIAALNAGVNVICEKPMSITSEEAENMKAAADKNGKLLQIGFVRRYGNDCRILKDFIDKGDLGEIYYAKAKYIRRNGCPGGWFGDKSRSGGGPLIDLGVHIIDYVRYCMGCPKPVSVYAATFEKLGNRPGIVRGKMAWKVDAKADIFDVEDAASVMIRFDGGQVLHIETSFSLNVKEDEGGIQLFGTKGGAFIDDYLEIYSEWNNLLTNVTFDCDTDPDFDTMFDNEIAHFIDCVRNGTECIAPAEDGIELMKILNAAYESAKTGHEVILG